MPTDFTYIEALSEHVGATVTLKGWLYNKRGSKGLYFLILRDGTGLAQCVVNEAEVDAPTWQAASDATQESALAITGAVVADERAVDEQVLREEGRGDQPRVPAKDRSTRRRR